MVEVTAELDRGDARLIQIVDASLAEAARKAGPWLVCRLGCTQCCIGVFPITQLDARRLRLGLASLDSYDPARALRVRQRARESVARLSADFPGDPATGLLAQGEEAEERFSHFADDEPCPALDPETGACDLYDARPITCRTFGPPVRCADESVGVCELCFEGATDNEIAACEVEIDPEGLESALVGDLEKSTGQHGQTIVAYALAL
ncbi:MAG TPA: YkgJ family cysteine cluster protein [Bryobacteraceae bacterium]|nr:YkgJ family cysteine cluster protein [Bryobacteraceae bacterium]